MLRHGDIWSAIDRLAHDRGLTASGLARRAGLDPTTFNKSKRITREGKPRWPSTESLAKVLDATGASLAEFLTLLPGELQVEGRHTLPLVSSSDIVATPRLDGELRTMLRDRDEISFPDGEQVFAMEVANNRLAPAYREGDVLIVSGGAHVRRGDRVLVRTADGTMSAAEMVRHGSRRVSFRPLGTPEAEAMILPVEQLSWILRILWASQ